ncbi:S8 family peptidase [Micromonospora sp. NBC_01813]|uniref:S8 family peptidase n=1 Tax=Micromonospora sp. NBC_01813 TaxID=2975988 RepID=UPI002DD91B3A|nr:S8 family peptidase [Micromonospora sp. NBC_01813]WSA10638.1 S8 family peptidase [Micromonospora sp. NBC_01813]
MSEPDEWDRRTLLALAGRSRPAGGLPVVLREVAFQFGDLFTEVDHAYRAGEPGWHEAVRRAVDRLRAAGLISGTRTLRLTDAGRQHTEAIPAERPSAATTPTGPAAGRPGATGPPIALPGTIADPLRGIVGRLRLGFPTGPDEPMPVLVAVNLHFAGGTRRATEHLAGLWFRATGGRHPHPLAGEYLVGELSLNQMKRLVAADRVSSEPADRAVHRIWPDFPVRPQIDVSAATIKADAARRTFGAAGQRIVWAVIDSGIDAEHPHFASNATLSAPEVRDLHRSFPGGGPPRSDGALVDESGHGTHVAGIIAGGIDASVHRQPPWAVRVIEHHYDIDNPTEPVPVTRELSDPTPMMGIAPQARLVSLKVLHGGGGLAERVSRVIGALAYVRQVNAQSDRVMRIHGVNLSVGYEFDPEWFACGQSPLCREVDKLVRSGVVVVTAAGNSGYGMVGAPFGLPSRFALGSTINDPGNAERAITVGATHRDMPHTYGVSYFSSKGPTGDGRAKPDLVAPGERIVSCAAGTRLAAAQVGWTGPPAAVYLEESGTSVAAPHVSGAVAAFLSVRREFIGQPDRVKQVLLATAVPLGRDPRFQGHGLVDLLRALQSV